MSAAIRRIGREIDVGRHPTLYRLRMQDRHYIVAAVDADDVAFASVGSLPCDMAVTIAGLVGGLITILCWPIRSVSPKWIETKGVDANGGSQTSDSQGIALRLDSVEMLLMLNTTKAGHLFVGRDDELELAGIAAPDRPEIHGVRNLTDGPACLARHAHVASARRERGGFPILLLVGAITPEAGERIRLAGPRAIRF